MAKVKAILHQHVGRKGSFDEVVNAAYRAVGDGGIVAICSFDCDDFYKPLINSIQTSDRYTRMFTDNRNACYVPEENITLVNAQEIRVKENVDIISLAQSEGKLVSKERTVEDAFKEMRDFGARILIPHPFFLWGTGKILEKARYEKSGLLDYIDSIEVYNTCLPSLSANKKAQDLFIKLVGDGRDIGCSSNSDATYFFEMYAKTGFTLIEEPDRTNSETFSASLGKALREVKNFENLGMDFSGWSKLGGICHSVGELPVEIYNQINKIKN